MIRISDLNKRVNNTVPWKYAIEMLKSEEMFGKFHEKELQKTNQTEFRVEIVIKKKGDT